MFDKFLSKVGVGAAFAILHSLSRIEAYAGNNADIDADGDIDLVFHFRVAETGYGCDTRDTTLTGSTFDGQPVGAGGNLAFGRDFAIGQDWTGTESVSFWYRGGGGGEDVTVTLKDNRAPDPGPDEWSLVWSDELNEPAGTPPNPRSSRSCKSQPQQYVDNIPRSWM